MCIRDSTHTDLFLSVSCADVPWLQSDFTLRSQPRLSQIYCSLLLWRISRKREGFKHLLNNILFFLNNKIECLLNTHVHGTELQSVHKRKLLLYWFTFLVVDDTLWRNKQPERLNRAPLWLIQGPIPGWGSQKCPDVSYRTTRIMQFDSKLWYIVKT